MSVAAVDGDGRYATLVARRRLNGAAAHAVMVASLNVVVGGAVAWRYAEPSDGYHTAAARGGEGPVPVWGASRSLPVAGAAMVNGALGHHFAFDDTADVLLGHPGVVLVPALLAVAAERPLPLDSYLSAYASGYECMVRLARQLNPGHYRHGFHATATLGALGAANAVSAALGADAAGRAAAVGLAASRAGGLRAGIGYPARAWHAGFAAAQGLEAAMLAYDGVRSSPAAVTGRHGFLSVFGSTEHRGSNAVGGQNAGIREEPALNGAAVLNLKEFPGCGALAPALSALEEALRRLGASTADVAHVDVTVNPFVLEVVSLQWPAHPAEAAFSLRYALATMLSRRRLRPQDLTAHGIGDPTMRGLAGRITIAAGNVGPTKYESSVRVRTRDGCEATICRPGVGGQPASRYTVGDVLARWLTCTRAATIEAARMFAGDGPADMAARTNALLTALRDEALTSISISVITKIP